MIYALVDKETLTQRDISLQEHLIDLQNFDIPILQYRNKIGSLTQKRDDKRYPDIETMLKNAPKDGNIPVYYVGSDKYMLDVSDDYDFLEKKIDGDSNGDFENLKDTFQDGNQTMIKNAVKEFISYLDMKLTGGLLNSEEKEVIFKALTKKDIYNHWADDDTKFAKSRQIMRNVIIPVYRAIVTSNKFMLE